MGGTSKTPPARDRCLHFRDETWHLKNSGLGDRSGKRDANERERGRERKPKEEKNISLRIKVNIKVDGNQGE